MVVDAHVDVLVADPAFDFRAVAVNAVPRASDDAGELLDVDVQEVSGIRQLVAVRRLRRLQGAKAPHAGFSKNPAHRRLGKARRLGDLAPHEPLASQLEHPSSKALWRGRGRAPRPAR